MEEEEEEEYSRAFLSVLPPPPPLWESSAWVAFLEEQTHAGGHGRKVGTEKKEDGYWNILWKPLPDRTGGVAVGTTVRRHAPEEEATTTTME